MSTTLKDLSPIIEWVQPWLKIVLMHKKLQQIYFWHNKNPKYLAIYLTNMAILPKKKKNHIKFQFVTSLAKWMTQKKF